MCASKIIKGKRNGLLRVQTGMAWIISDMFWAPQNNLERKSTEAEVVSGGCNINSSQAWFELHSRENFNYALQAFCPMTSVKIDRRRVHACLSWTSSCHFMPPLRTGVCWKQGLLTHSVNGKGLLLLHWKSPCNVFVCNHKAANAVQMIQNIQVLRLHFFLYGHVDTV